MEKVFINDNNQENQYCLLVDDKHYYKFNGKFALYELSVIPEKIHVAERLGKYVKTKQVFGFFNGKCNNGHVHEMTPIVKHKEVYTCFCSECGEMFLPNKIIRLEDVRKNYYSGILFDEYKL